MREGENRYCCSFHKLFDSNGLDENHSLRPTMSMILRDGDKRHRRDNRGCKMDRARSTLYYLYVSFAPKKGERTGVGLRWFLFPPFSSPSPLLDRASWLSRFRLGPWRRRRRQLSASVTAVGIGGGHWYYVHVHTQSTSLFLPRSPIDGRYRLRNPHSTQNSKAE